jgi:two-component system, OmpR family, phosphate regulon response regulator OmpR
MRQELDQELGAPAMLDDNAPHLLIVDDDTRIRSLLSQFLFENGYRISVAVNAQEARRKLENFDFDVLILDVMMPGENGVDLTKSLRKTKNVPILMLTALSETEARITGLEAGADDYLSKPFDPRELCLRLNNILKRGMSLVPPRQELVAFGPFTFHMGKRELKRGTHTIRLTDREQDIMIYFCQNIGTTVPRYELIRDDSDIGERTIDVQINRLRRKIEADPSNPIYLQTVRGIGYKFNAEISL